MRRFVLFALLLITFGFSQSLMAECYLTVENSGNLDTKAITQISMVQISQHFEPVNEIPPQGIGTDACVYTLAVSEISNGILVTIKGRNASTYGDSKLRGFDGFQHALFRAIISAKPEQKDPICQRYAGIMGTDCGGVVTQPAAPVETKGTLIVRVPHDYRYAQILSSGRLIGEMAGEIVREFEVETGVTLVLKAVDGIYQSAELYTSVQPNVPTRVDFKGFKSTQAVQPTPAATPAPAPAPRYEEKDEPDFGEDGAVIIGFSLTPGYSFSNVEEDDVLRAFFDEDPSGLALDLFFDYFFNQNLGIGGKFFSVTAVAETPNGSASLTASASSMMLIASVWFPLSTKNKGYSHFGLQAGAGSATYTLQYEETSGYTEKYEADGSATTWGAFLDWGGEVFGARLGYNSFSTSFDKPRWVEQNGSPRDQVQDWNVDMSGSGIYLTLRWAF